MLRQYDGVPCPDVEVEPKDPALLIFTGSTTGLPKAALGTHHGLRRGRHHSEG